MLNVRSGQWNSVRSKWAKKEKIISKLKYRELQFEDACRALSSIRFYLFDVTKGSFCAKKSLNSETDKLAVIGEGIPSFKVV